MPVFPLQTSGKESHITSAFERVPLGGAKLKRNIQSRGIRLRVVGEKAHCEASDSGFHSQVNALSIQAAATFEAR